MGRGLALPTTFVYRNPGREYSHVCIEQVTDCKRDPRGAAVLESREDGNARQV